MALALLAGRNADRLASTMLGRIESHLRLAAETADSATAWAVWGIVRFSAYRINNLAMGEPGLTTIRGNLERLGRDSLDLDLLAILPRSGEAERYFRLDQTRDSSAR